MTENGSFEALAAASALIDTIERGDIEGMGRLYAIDAVQHHPMAENAVVGRRAIEQSERELFEMFSEVSVQRRASAYDEPVLFLEVVLRATNSGPIVLDPGNTLPPTNRRVAIEATWVLRFDADGLIVEERDYFDTGALFRQLGLVD